MLNSKELEEMEKKLDDPELRKLSGIGLHLITAVCALAGLKRFLLTVEESKEVKNE